MVAWLAFVLAEGANLVSVGTATGGLQDSVGHRGRSQAHELTECLGERPECILHAGQSVIGP